MAEHQLPKLNTGVRFSSSALAMSGTSWKPPWRNRPRGPREATFRGGALSAAWVRTTPRMASICTVIVALAACGSGSEREQPRPPRRPAIDSATTAVAETPPPTTAAATGRSHHRFRHDRTTADDVTRAPVTTALPKTVPSTSTAPIDPSTDAEQAAQIPQIDGFTALDMPTDDVLLAANQGSRQGPDAPCTSARRGRHRGRSPGGRRLRNQPDGDRQVRRRGLHRRRATPHRDDDLRRWYRRRQQPGELIWTGLAGAAVIRAATEFDEQVHWAWGTGDDDVHRPRHPRCRDVRDRAAAQQVPTLDPWDQQGMTGDLFDPPPDDRRVRLPRHDSRDGAGSTSADAAAATASSVSTSATNCRKAPRTTALTDSVSVALMRIAKGCAQNGFTEQVAAYIASLKGFETQQIARIQVRRRLQRAVLGR